MYNFDNFPDKRLLVIDQNEVKPLLQVFYINTAMKQLLSPTQYRYLQYFAANLSQSEIANICGVAPCTVSRTLKRAMARLELYLAGIMCRCDIDSDSPIYRTLEKIALRSQ